jgi:hypothetical protein
MHFRIRIPDYATVTRDELIFTPLTAAGFFRRAMPHLTFDTGMEKREFPFRTGLRMPLKYLKRSTWKTQPKLSVCLNPQPAKVQVLFTGALTNRQAEKYPSASRRVSEAHLPAIRLDFLQGCRSLPE